MEPQVHYCTSRDGTRIAYTDSGTGPPLVFTMPHPTSIELDHELPDYAEFFETIARSVRLIRFDMRGCGASQRDVDDLSAEAQADDISAVADHLGLERFDLFGGVWIPAHAAVIYAARRPDRVAHLILWAPVPSIGPAAGPAAEAQRVLILDNWRAATRVMADSFAPYGSIEVKKVLTRICREILSAEGFLRLDSTASDISAVLLDVRVPTLVMNTRNDRSFALAESRVVASAIPNAQTFVVEGNTADIFRHREEVIGRMLEFIGVVRPNDLAHEERASHSSAFRTVLFTDLVGHSEMMSRLGDDRGRDVLREHERLTREVLKANGGTEVKTMGDGFMASFGSVTKAVGCAVALQRSFAERKGEPLAIRVGLNAGEPIEEDGDLFGATVILASRVAARAGAGEIFVANAVRELCAGKGFVFSSRGEFVAKGFEEPLRVYEVSWRG